LPFAVNAPTQRIGDDVGRIGFAPALADDGVRIRNAAEERHGFVGQVGDPLDETEIGRWRFANARQGIGLGNGAIHAIARDNHLVQVSGRLASQLLDLGHRFALHLFADFGFVAG